MRSYITYDQLDALIKYADGQSQSIDLELVNALSTLNYAVQKNVAKELLGARRRNTMLSEKLNGLREKRATQYEEGKFEETDIDSADVANALLYQLQLLKTYRLSASKVMLILYDMYATWLEGKGERLCLEHPVATEYGPRFWHAFKRVNVNVPVAYDTWKAFAERRPDLAAFTKNVAFKYYDIAEPTLRSRFNNSMPLQNAAPKNNGGKWNKEIADKDIYHWKKQQTNKTLSK